MSQKLDNCQAIELLVIRTDYSDDAAWRAVLSQLDGPSGIGKLALRRRIVENKKFEEASPEAVVSTVFSAGGSGVVFVADAATMCGPHPLLAVTPLFRDDIRIDEEFRQMMRFGNVFRLVPAVAADTIMNLAVGNLRFWEFARAADSDPERIYRGYLDVSPWR